MSKPVAGASVARALRVHGARTLKHLESWSVGPMAAPVRANLRIEVAAWSVYGAFAIMLVFIPVVLRRMGASAEALAVYNALMYVGNITAGVGLWLLQSGRAHRLATICWLVSRGSFLVVALITDHVTFLIFAGFYWLFDQLALPAYSQIVQRLYPVEQRARAMGVVRLSMALPMLLLTPLAGWLLDEVGYRVLFSAAGLVGLLSAVLFARLRVDETPPAPPPAAPLAAAPARSGTRAMMGILRRDRRYAVYLTSLVFFGLSGLIANPILPLVQVDRLRLTYAELGWLNVAYSLARLIGYMGWGRLIDRIGAVRALPLAFMLNVIYIAPYIWADQGWMLLPAFVATGLVSSGVDIAFVNVAIQLAEPGRVAEYMTLQLIVIGARGIVAPFIGVGLLHAGVSEATIFALCCGLALLSAWIVSRVRVTGASPPAAS